MITALSDLDLLGLAFAAYPKNQSMFASDTARPPSSEGMLKGLWFPEPLERITPDVFDEFIDGLENFYVLFLPFDVFLPSCLSPGDFHVALAGSINSRSVSLPSLAS